MALAPNYLSGRARRELGSQLEVHRPKNRMGRGHHFSL